MSHFSRIAIKFKDQACLVEALQRVGFYPQIYSQAVQLYGYRGDKRQQVAHIVVPRQQVGRASNDIGFYWTGTEYEALVSEYDLSCRPDFLKQLQSHYVELYVQKLAHQLGGEVVQKTTQGTVSTVRITLPVQSTRR